MKRIASLMFLILWNSAFCEPSPTDLVAYKDAGTRLMTLIAAAQDAAKISQLKTPEVMCLIRTVSDESKVLRTGPYAASELGTLQDICDVANRVSVSLSLFGLKAHLGSVTNQQQVQSETVALVTSNTMAFQEELKEVQPFLVRRLAKQIPPMTQFVASLTPAEFTDVRRQGLAQVRSGLVQIYAGAFQAATDSRYSDEFRLDLLGALAESSDLFASAFELPVRRQLFDMAKVAATNAAGSYKRHLDHIAGSLGNERCDGLCAVR